MQQTPKSAVDLHHMYAMTGQIEPPGVSPFRRSREIPRSNAIRTAKDLAVSIGDAQKIRWA